MSNKKSNTNNDEHKTNTHFRQIRLGRDAYGLGCMVFGVEGGGVHRRFLGFAFKQGSVVLLDLGFTLVFV